MNDVAKKCLGMDGAEYLNTRNNSRDDLIFKENLLQTMRECWIQAISAIDSPV